MSSRNRYLSDSERSIADGINVALQQAEFGLEAVKAGLDPAIRLDYVALVDPNTFEEIDESFKGQALLIFAGRVGNTRLLDNLSITI